MQKATIPSLLLASFFAFSATSCGKSKAPDSTLPSSDASSATSDSTLPDLNGHVDENNNGYCDDCDRIVHTHADENHDGLCDVCNAKTQAELDFYSINDIHGKFETTSYSTGVERMTTYLQAQQTEKEDVVLLSTGDSWQGSAESNTTRGKLFVEWFNELGFAAMAMGNHEYDWGESTLRENAELAEFPFLAINIYDKTTRERVDYCESSVLVERSGIRIGVIGAIGDCYSSIAYEQVQNVYFQTGNALTRLVQAESDRLRERGAEVVVYLLHDSAKDTSSAYDVSLSKNGYIDLVFEGHTHQKERYLDGGGVYHVQAGGDNQTGLSHATIEVNLLENTHAVTAEIVEHASYASYEESTLVQEVLNRYSVQLSPLTTPLGYNAAYRNYDAIANATAEAMYLAGVKRWGDSKYADKIVCGGGFIKPRSPYEVYVGQVDYRDIYPLLPFDNPMVLCAVSGARLKKQFVENTSYYTYYSEQYRQNLKNLNDKETYYVVVDTYCANFNYSGMGFMEIVEYYDETTPYYNRYALAEFIYNGGWSK